MSVNLCVNCFLFNLQGRLFFKIVENDQELEKVKDKLGKMPGMSKERTTSIMRDQRLYQDLSPDSNDDTEPNDDHEASPIHTAHSQFYMASPSGTLASEHALEAIKEESYNKSVSISLSVSMSSPKIVRRQRKEGLWQHQKNVMESGILETMTPNEIKLQEALFEIITSEESNLKSLDILVTLFKSDFEDESNSNNPSRQRKSSSKIILILKFLLTAYA